MALLRQRPVDLMIVIGGYNSSNTCNLARICAASPTFHIAEPGALTFARSIRHRPIGSHDGAHSGSGVPRLAAGRPITIGLTAGASTPNNLVGDAVLKLAEFTAG